VMEDVIKTAHDAISTCRVINDVWIGDFRTATQVADAILISPCAFAAVFNTSGIELTGLTLEPKYAARKIAYATSVCTETGMTLVDGPFDDDATFPTTAARAASLSSRVSVTIGTAQERVMNYPYVTRKSFLYMIVRSADLINELVQGKPRERVLVHCMVGMNRASAAIAAYMILHLGYLPRDAIDVCEKVIRDRRYMRCLTNHDFRAGLNTLKPTVNRDLLKREYMIEYGKIMTRAHTVRRVGAEYEEEAEAVGTITLDLIGEMFTRRHPFDMCCIHCGAAGVPLFRCACCGRIYCSRRCQQYHHRDSI
jgi:hypothetical protein